MAQKKKSGGKGSKASGKSSRKKATRKKATKKAARKPTRKKAARKKATKKATKKTARKKAAGKRSPKGPARKAARKTTKKSAKKAAKSATRKRTRKPAGTRKPTLRTPSGGGRRGGTRGRGKRGPEFYEKFRQRLLAERERISTRLDELREELAGLDETPRELEEWAQEEKDRDILIRLEERETDELRRIQAALQLIDQREYGICQNCGKPIPVARLEELPTAFRCVDCMA